MVKKDSRRFGAGLNLKIFENTGYLIISEATVLEWVRQYDFLARKISGQWESSHGLIEEWRVNQIRNQPKEDKKAS